MQNLNLELMSLSQKHGQMEETMIAKQKNLDRVVAKLQTHKERNAELDKKVYAIITHTNKLNIHRVSNNCSKFETIPWKDIS